MFPSERQILIPSITQMIRFLNIGNNRIIFTGGDSDDGDGKTATNKCYILNVENKEIVEFPYLKYPRRRHSMTWLDKNPAVIGGDNGDNCHSIKSVEMFKNDKWIEMAPINIARYYHVSVCTQQNSWVIGGAYDYTILDSIEKYGNNSWSVLKLRLNTPIAAVGVCSLENNIILFGGMKSETEAIKNTFLIDINNLCITELNQIRAPGYFGDGSTYVDSEQIYQGDHKYLSVTKLIINQIYL